jgi:hypothetical protein
VAVPTRAEQIKRIAEYIDTPEADDTDAEAIAKRIVDGIYTMWMQPTLGNGIPQRHVEWGPIPLKVGMSFKVPLVARIYHVAWIGRQSDLFGDMQDMVWCITADSLYGTLTTYGHAMWRVVSEAKGEAGKPGFNASGWLAGELVRMGKYGNSYKILAVGDKCALLRDRREGYLHIESSKELDKRYTRELF